MKAHDVRSKLRHRPATKEECEKAIREAKEREEKKQAETNVKNITKL